MRLPAENIKAAREVQLVDFLNTYRPGELVRKSRDEYCTKSHSSLRITPSKNLFHWCSQSKGGRGALDYLLTVEGMSFRSAVMLLNEMELVPFQQARAAAEESSRTHDFTLPRPDKNAQAATAYLMHRGISPKVLRYCLNEGILYQTTRGNYRNCVFVGKDEGGVPRSAFQRGCQGTYRGDVTGSQKKYGFLMQAENPDCDTVELYEAPIDAMSGATLRRYTDIGKWRSVHYLALGGLNHLPIDYFLQQHPLVKNVVLCFDRDEPGLRFADTVAQRLAERGCNVEKRLPAVGKDYNENLIWYKSKIEKQRGERV